MKHRSFISISDSRVLIPFGEKGSQFSCSVDRFQTSTEAIATTANPLNRDTVHRLENQSGGGSETDDPRALRRHLPRSRFSSRVLSLDSHAIRPGKGKMRNRRYISRKGPLIVYGTEGSKIVKAFRNIPGVVVASVVVANGREEEEQFSPPLVPLEQGEEEQ
uniref:Uncharacterized protein n=1 Tax=Nelumbo nucifera TaxID=4432 RepID=A0A822YBV6_NELNU|nr:TPA_asm: hypothetical protein HUJ06_030021 [Nelumbo nucifera]DAD28556.1 TPA_asm: hypothetical protein HUJ06_030024 [Nelumbo nucifera]